MFKILGGSVTLFGCGSAMLLCKWTLIIKDIKNFKKYPESLPPSLQMIKWSVLLQQLAKTKHITEQRALL